MSRRHLERAADAIRPIEIETGFMKTAAGSVLYQAGGTRVLVNASIVDEAPEWLEGGGWLTAEYHMHPCAGPRRQGGAKKRRGPDGRATEIARLIGRSLRAAVLLEELGPRTIVVDCDVLEADGGTRTACINAGTVAVALALEKMRSDGRIGGGVMRGLACAISAGKVGDSLFVDLDYKEDVRADVDLNVIGFSTGELIEIQGGAEGAPIARSTLNSLTDLAFSAFSSVVDAQRQALNAVSLEKIVRKA